MSDTPRTDREVYKITERDIGFEAVGATLCRTIERELAQAVNSFSDGANRWIPVSERLPEEGARVLAFWQVADGMTPNHENYAKALFTHGSWMDDGGDNLYADASHWMPLPEAPK